MTVLTREDIDRSPSQTLDDLLRQVPGFSLFRRSSSLVGHPTTQGVSLRGIGPSGTSRALVLLDGVPINDPFGGWVYWDRVPLQGVEQVEVVRGGGSSVWGNYALGGVINVITRRPTERAALSRAATATTTRATSTARVRRCQGPFRLSLEGNYFDTDGYPIVKKSVAGSIDIDATSQHSTFNGRARARAVAGSVVLPARELLRRGPRQRHPAADQRHRRRDRFATGGRLRTGDGSEWSSASTPTSRSSRARSPPRRPTANSETLALDQRVPSDVGGRRASVEPAASATTCCWPAATSAGSTARPTSACSTPASSCGTRVAGGEQVIGGVFVQDVWTPAPAVGAGRRRPRRLLARLRRLPPRHAAAGRHPAEPDLRRHRPDHREPAPRRALARDADHRRARLRLPGLPRADAQRAVPRLPRAQRRDGRQRAPQARAVDRRRARRRAAVGAVRGARDRLLERGEGPRRQRDARDAPARLPAGHHVPPAPEPRPRAHPRARDGAELRPSPDWRSSRATSSPTPGSWTRRSSRRSRASAWPRCREHGGDARRAAIENPQLLNASAMVRFVGAPVRGRPEHAAARQLLGVRPLPVSAGSRSGPRSSSASRTCSTRRIRVGRTSDGVVSIGAPLLVHGGIRISLR